MRERERERVERGGVERERERVVRGGVERERERKEEEEGKEVR